MGLAEDRQIQQVSSQPGTGNECRQALESFKWNYTHVGVLEHL